MIAKIVLRLRYGDLTWLPSNVDLKFGLKFPNKWRPVPSAQETPDGQNNARRGQIKYP